MKECDADKNPVAYAYQVFHSLVTWDRLEPEHHSADLIGVYVAVHGFDNPRMKGTRKAATGFGRVVFFSGVSKWIHPYPESSQPQERQDAGPGDRGIHVAPPLTLKGTSDKKKSAVKRFSYFFIS